MVLFYRLTAVMLHRQKSLSKAMNQLSHRGKVNLCHSQNTNLFFFLQQWPLRCRESQRISSGGGGHQLLQHPNTNNFVHITFSCKFIKMQSSTKLSIWHLGELRCNSAAVRATTKFLFSLDEQTHFTVFNNSSPHMITCSWVQVKSEVLSTVLVSVLLYCDEKLCHHIDLSFLTYK